MDAMTIHSGVFSRWSRFGSSAILVAFLALVLVPGAFCESPRVSLTRLSGKLYVAEDYYYAKENSAVYVGDSYVTVIGATWTPETARLLAAEIAKVTPKPIREVIDTNHDLDRAGGNAYFKSIGASIVSTRMTRDLLMREGEASVHLARQGFRDFPDLEIVLPDKVFDGDFALQHGNVRAMYLGPSHKSDDIFVYFPEEKALYAGCVLKEELGSLDGADLAEYPKTLRKLKDLNLDIVTIIAGHFSPIQGPELIDRYLRMLTQVR
jgi:metallo-beta-lactamase class B